MTKQQMFDRVATHLLTQKKRAMKLGTCRYRGPGGTKCAIGALIPDAAYTDDLEDYTVYSPAVCDAAGIGPQQQELARRLQQIHDTEVPRVWRRKLEEVAQTFRLNKKVLNAAP